MADQNPYLHWFDGMDFSTDWTSVNFPIWDRIFSEEKDQITRILEIGSWEGRSAVFFANYFQHAQLTCVDTFKGGEENHRNSFQRDQISEIEARFDNNLSAFTHRVRKLSMRSFRALEMLHDDNQVFDFIYIDGSHMRNDVMVDSLSAWPLVRPGGLVLWDDYGGGGVNPPSHRVAPAVDVFLDWHKDELEEIHRAYQICVRKTG